MRQEVVERLEKGETFDAGQIKQLVKQAKHHVNTAHDQAGSAGSNEIPVNEPHAAADAAPRSNTVSQDDEILEEDQGAIARHEDCNGQLRNVSARLGLTAEIGFNSKTTVLLPTSDIANRASEVSRKST